MTTKRLRQLQELYSPRYTVDQVAKASGLEPHTLRSWFTSKWIEPSENDVRGQKGIATMLSLASAMRIGIAAELVSYGMKPRYALYAALAFSATNGSDFSERLERLSGRDPATLFRPEKGETFLLAWRPDHEEVLEHLEYPSPISNEAAMVMPIQNCIPLSVFHKIRGPNVGQDSYCIVWCNRVCKSVARRLGAAPVYSEE